MVRKFRVVWELILVALVAALLVGQVGASAPSSAYEVSPGTGNVDVYDGIEREGIDSRRACSFLDGIYNMRAEIAQGVIIVTDPLNVEYYRSEKIDKLAGYSVQQITCLRSAQTGKLVLTVGGFPIGGGTQLSKTLATDYFINQPVPYEDYTINRPVAYEDYIRGSP